jgi:hypothetical protein
VAELRGKTVNEVLGLDAREEDESAETEEAEREPVAVEGGATEEE